MFLVALAMRPAAAVFYWCQRWLPSNRLVTLLRTRRGYRWGLPAVLLGVLHFLAGVGCYGAVRLGHTEWFYLGMLICWWTALKLVVHGLAATLRLLIARSHENLAVRAAIRNERRTALAEGRTAPTHTPAERRRIIRNVRHTLLAQ